MQRAFRKKRIREQDNATKRDSVDACVIGMTMIWIEAEEPHGMQEDDDDSVYDGGYNEYRGLR